MGNATMGKVLVQAKIENLADLFSVHQGLLKPEEVRSIEVTDALVDTSSTGLLMPKRLILQLGLRPLRTHQVQGISGSTPLPMYCAVRLTIKGRDCSLDVAEIDDALPVLIGLAPLGMLDWVVDPKGQRLIGNPAHGGKHMMEVF